MRRSIAVLVMASLMLQAMILIDPNGLEQNVDGLKTRGETIYVGPDENYTSIQAAINSASSGDHILVKGGTYKGDILVNKRIELKGSTLDPVYLEECVLNVTASDTQIQDLILNGSDTKFESGRIYIMNADAVIVRYCTFNGYSSGVRLEGSDLSMIIDNEFNSGGSHTDNRIILDESDDNRIYRNEIYAEDEHIVLDESSGNEVLSNKIIMTSSDLKTASAIVLDDGYGNKINSNELKNLNNGSTDTYGICLFSMSSNNSISGMDISDFDYGLHITGISNHNTIWNLTLIDSKILIDYSVGNIIFNSTITSESMVWDEMNRGITLDHARYTRLINCSVGDKKYGIYLRNESNRNLIKDCRVYDNLIGINIEGENLLNNILRCEVFNNNMTGISIQRSTNGDLPRLKIMGTIIRDNSVGISMDNVREINITECLIDNNTMGLHLDIVNNFFLTYSRISSNYHGAIFERCEKGEIRHNLLENNTNFALKLEGNSFKRCTDFQVYLNVFDSNNGVNATYNSSRLQIRMPDWYNSGESNSLNRIKRGNYWSDLQTPDSDSNGVVDTPYVINSVNQDNFPITEKLDNYDHPPIIKTENVLEAYPGIEYYVQYEAVDLDTKASGLNWTMRDNASWLTLTKDGKLSGTPDEDDWGFYFVDIYVTDGDQWDFTRFHLTMKDPSGSSHPPEIITEDVKTAYIDQQYYVQYEATDRDTSSDMLLWNWSTNSTWLSFHNRVLKGTPDESDPDSCWVNISVNDGENTTYSYFIINVKEENKAPNITTDDVLECYEDQLYSVDYNATDDEPLKWSLYTEADFLTINEDTGVLKGIPENGDVGSWYVHVIVSDGITSTGSNFTLKVINTNDPPVITGVPKGHATQNTTYTQLMTGKDIDPTSDVLTWSMRSDSSFLFINSTSGLIKGKPDNDEVGSWWVEVTLSDGNGGSDVLNYTLNVNNTNDPPSTPKIEFSNTTLYQGGNQIVTASCIDPDLIYGDQLNFTWSINGTGIIGYGPSINLSLLKGNYTLTLRVTDSSGNYSEISVSVSILDPEGQNDIDENPEGPSLWLISIIIFLCLTTIIFFMLIYRRGRRSEDDEEDYDWDVPDGFDRGKTKLGSGPEKGLRSGAISHLEFKPSMENPEDGYSEDSLIESIMDRMDEDILWEEDMEVVEDLLHEAISYRRPSSYRISTVKLEKGLRRRHQKGEISIELFESLLEIVNRWEEE